MIVGFTGTQRGMTNDQKRSVRRLLVMLPVTELHHGDCIGADEQSHDFAYAIGVPDIIVHPPDVDKKRAFCKGTRILPPAPYLARNKAIVAAGTDGLIATPKDYTEPANKRGQGTWTTVGYARQAGRKIWLVLPNGDILES